MAVQLSTAGAHAQVLAKMLGGRAELSELMSGPLAPALLAFNSKGKTSDAFRNKQGCVARNEGFLHFAGTCSLFESRCTSGVWNAQRTFWGQMSPMPGFCGHFVTYSTTRL